MTGLASERLLGYPSKLGLHVSVFYPVADTRPHVFITARNHLLDRLCPWTRTTRTASGCLTVQLNKD